MDVIDSHIHCGIQNVSLPYSRIEPLLLTAKIRGACLYPPVEDIYHRYSRYFDDNENWQNIRSRARTYLLELSETHEEIYVV